MKLEKAQIKDTEEILKLLNNDKNLLGNTGEKFTLNEVKSYIKTKLSKVLVSKIDNKIRGIIIAHFWEDYCYKNFQKEGLYWIICQRKKQTNEKFN